MSDDDSVTLSASGRLSGTIRPPGDKSIAHRGLIFAALAEGSSSVTGLPNGEDVRRTRTALAALGCSFDGDTVIGGRSRLRPAKHPLDAGNSGTTARLMSGVAASLAFTTEFDGDASLRRRPMRRVIGPLELMGARISSNGGRLPIRIEGGGLVGIDYAPEVASAQVKGAVLLAGLDADGATTVREKVATRRHTEELFARAGVSLDIEQSEAAGYAVTVRRSELEPFSLRVPGDPSQAAFPAVAAAVQPGARVRLEAVYSAKERLGFVDVLRRMGASIEIEEREPNVGDLVVEGTSLHGTVIAGEEVASMIDELPVLAVAACFAEGTTTISDAAELRVKESDRIATMTEGLSRLGARIEERPDGFVIEGGGFQPSGHVSSHGDHRVAMALAVAALCAGDGVSIAGFRAATATSWPDFLDDMARIA